MLCSFELGPGLIYFSTIFKVLFTFYAQDKCTDLVLFVLKPYNIFRNFCYSFCANVRAQSHIHNFDKHQRWSLISHKQIHIRWLIAPDSKGHFYMFIAQVLVGRCAAVGDISSHYILFFVKHFFSVLTHYPPWLLQQHPIFTSSSKLPHAPFWVTCFYSASHTETNYWSKYYYKQI